MPQKRKKTEGANKSINGVLMPPKGLFFNRTSKDHLLDNLRKGLLFHNESLLVDQPTSQLPLPYREDEAWLNQITIGQEPHRDTIDTIIDEDSPATPPQATPTQLHKHLLKHLPTIPFKTIPSQGTYRRAERKCNKVACFEKKLLAMGAWNKENKNGIDQNIQRLALTMGKSRSKYVQNDFERVAGLSVMNHSFDHSILSLKGNLSMTQSNPFQCHSLAGLAHKQPHKPAKPPRQLVKSQQSSKSQGYYVPTFLLNSLSVHYLENTPKLKYC